MIMIIATIKYGSNYYNTFTMGVSSNYHGYFFQCRYRKLIFGHYWKILKRQMSWTLRRNTRDIVDERIVFSFHLDICQQCPDIDRRYLLFFVYIYSKVTFKPSF